MELFLRGSVAPLLGQLSSLKCSLNRLCVCVRSTHFFFCYYHHMNPTRQTCKIRIKSKPNKRFVAGCAGLVNVRSGLQRASLAAWNVSLYTVQSCLLPVVKLCLWGLAASTLAGDLLPYLGKACACLWGPAVVGLFLTVFVAKLKANSETFIYKVYALERSDTFALITGFGLGMLPINLLINNCWLQI